MAGHPDSKPGSSQVRETDFERIAAHLESTLVVGSQEARLAMRFFGEVLTDAQLRLEREQARGNEAEARAPLDLILGVIDCLGVAVPQGQTDVRRLLEICMAASDRPGTT